MKSVWTHSIAQNTRAPLEGNGKTDVLVIGAGLAGVLTAWRLQEAGVKCMLVEAKMAGGGVTQNTTGKITAQHGLIYADLIGRFGMERTRQYYDANTSALAEYRALSERFPCDLEQKTAYTYAVDDRRKLEREAQAYEKLGLPAHITPAIPLPFHTAGALAMENQAQFNPMKLLTALTQKLPLYEHTFVHKIDGNTAYTQRGSSITAGHIVLATHYPLVNIPGLYFVKLYQHRSYVIALSDAPQIEGMYVDEKQEGHSFRTYGELLLVGGGDHKTGKAGGNYAELRALTARAWPQATEKYHWATQDCMPLDGVPYLGRHRQGTPHVLVATGFNKWGMTGAMVAARVLTELIVEGKSTLEELYSPQRAMKKTQLLVNLGAAVAGLASIGGPRCPHMGCKLRWNSVEHTWDCTCHGSRFEKSGHIINNPAKRGIRP